jgi:hypothetical protein
VSNVRAFRNVLVATGAIAALFATLASFRAVAGEARKFGGDSEHAATQPKAEHDRSNNTHDPSKPAQSCRAENPTLAGLFDLLAQAKAQGVPYEPAADGSGHLEEVDFAATTGGVDEAALKRVEQLLNSIAAKLDCQHASAPQAPGRRVPPGRRRHHD